MAAQLDSLLATIDADHNGVISYKEFKRWMGDPPGTAARRSPPRERPPWDGSIYSAETLADSSPLRDVAKSSPKGAGEDASLEPAELLKSYREDLASDRPSSVKEAIAAVRRRTGGMDATVVRCTFLCVPLTHLTIESGCLQDGGGGMADASTVAAEMKRCLDIEHEVEVLQVRRHLQPAAFQRWVEFACARRRGLSRTGLRCRSLARGRSTLAVVWATSCTRWTARLSSCGWRWMPRTSLSCRSAHLPCHARP